MLINCAVEWKADERREVYLEVKKARQVARKAKNDEWIKLGESLQHDFVKNQRNFWKKIRITMKGSHEEGRVCAENGQVICGEEEVRERWKEYFTSLLSPVSRGSRGDHSRGGTKKHC